MFATWQIIPFRLEYKSKPNVYEVRHMKQLQQFSFKKGGFVNFLYNTLVKSRIVSPVLQDSTREKNKCLKK